MYMRGEEQYMCAVPIRGQKRASDALEPELLAVVSSLVDAED